MCKIETFVFFELKLIEFDDINNLVKIMEMSMVTAKRSHILGTGYGDRPKILSKLVLNFNPGHLTKESCTPATEPANASSNNECSLTNAVTAIIHNFLSLATTPVCLVADNGLRIKYPILRTMFDKKNKTLPEDLLCVDLLPGFDTIMARSSTKNSPLTSSPSGCEIRELRNSNSQPNIVEKVKLTENYYAKTETQFVNDDFNNGISENSPNVINMGNDFEPYTYTTHTGEMTSKKNTPFFHKANSTIPSNVPTKMARKFNSGEDMPDGEYQTDIHIDMFSDNEHFLKLVNLEEIDRRCDAYFSNDIKTEIYTTESVSNNFKKSLKKTHNDIQISNETTPKKEIIKTGTIAEVPEKQHNKATVPLNTTKKMKRKLNFDRKIQESVTDLKPNKISESVSNIDFRNIANYSASTSSNVEINSKRARLTFYENLDKNMPDGESQSTDIHIAMFRESNNEHFTKLVNLEEIDRRCDDYFSKEIKKEIDITDQLPFYENLDKDMSDGEYRSTDIHIAMFRESNNEHFTKLVNLEEIDRRCDDYLSKQIKTEIDITESVTDSTPKEILESVSNIDVRNILNFNASTSSNVGINSKRARPSFSRNPDVVTANDDTSGKLSKNLNIGNSKSLDATTSSNVETGRSFLPEGVDEPNTDSNECLRLQHICERFLGNDWPGDHSRAEVYSFILLDCVVAAGKEFAEWADGNCQLVNEIPCEVPNW